MILGAEEHTGDVGNGKSDEGHGTAEGRGDGGKHTGHEEQPVARPSGIDAKVLGILLAQQQGVEGLDEQQRTDESQQTDDGKGRHLFHGDAAEVAQSPYHIRLYALFRCEEIKQ